MKRRVILWGLLASVACAAVQGLGLLDPLERWAYDVRVRRCQWFMPRPDQRVVHVDVDDGTLKAQGMWPLHRDVLAATIGELDRAGASAIGVDFLLDLPAPPRLQKRNDGAVEEVDDDALLETAIRASGKVVLAGDEGLLPRFADAAAGVGIAKTVLGEDGAVRQVVAVKRGAGPGGQPGLGFALRLAGVAEHVPAEGVVVERRGVRLTSAGGGERFVPLTWDASGHGVMQVPFFGTRDWITAYDVPAHRTSARHVALIAAYQAVECERKIVANDLTAERAIGPMAEMAGLAELETPKPSDWPAYRSRITRVLQAMESPLKELKAIESELDPPTRRLLDAADALRKIVQVNDTLARRVESTRARLRAEVNGRVVLVGGMATGMGDRVPTSLHRECPGVVVHGMALNGILSGEVWRCVPGWVNMVATLAVGLLMTWVAASVRAVWMVVAAVAIGAGYAVVNGVILFDWGNVILGVMGPITAVAAVTVVSLTIRAAAAQQPSPGGAGG